MPLDVVADVGDGAKLCEAACKALAEMYVAHKDHDAIKRMKEEYGVTVDESLMEMPNRQLRESLLSGSVKVVKEDVNTTTAAGSYVTMLADTIYYAALDEMPEIMELVTVNEDLMRTKGADSLQLPRALPTEAVIFAEGQQIDSTDETIDSVLAAPRPFGIRTRITWQIEKRGHPDLMKMILTMSVGAVKRKIMTDILDGLADGAGLTETGGVTYDNIIDATAQVESATTTDGIPYGFIASHIVLHTNQLAALKKTTDWKEHVFRATVMPGSQSVVIDRPVEFFGVQKIFGTPFLDVSKALGLVMDAVSYPTAIWVKEADMETREQQINGSIDKELILFVSAVLVVLYPKGICKITA